MFKTLGPVTSGISLRGFPTPWRGSDQTAASLSWFSTTAAFPKITLRCFPIGCHTPRAALAKNWGVSESALAPLGQVPPEGRYIFQAPVPGPLEQDRLAATRSGRKTEKVFEFHMLQMSPQKASQSGEVRIVDSRNFPMATNVIMAHVTLKPGGMRELHWHPNADEWQYYIAGRGRMTLFHNKSAARTADFNAGDVGYVPRTLGHYIENTGASDLVFLEMFRAPIFCRLNILPGVNAGTSKQSMPRLFSSRFPEPPEMLRPGSTAREHATRRIIYSAS
jgi:oxalate decarboxylase family bicupin protein